MLNWIFPLIIRTPKLALFYYEPTEQQYIIEAFGVALEAKQSLIIQDAYISLRDNKEHFLSADSVVPKTMQKGQRKVCYMKFDTDIPPLNFAISLPTRENMKGRIVVGRCKSAYFDIILVDFREKGPL